MSEKPYKLPEGWRWVRLGEILVEKPQYGYTSSASPDPVGPKFLRITDITSGEIVWENVPYCNIDAQSLSKYRLRSGDILFARTGSIGATILVEEVPCEAIFASYLIRVRLQTGILPEFVSLILKAPPCQRQFVPLGAAQKNINAKAIQQIILPFPPLSEQRRIVARIEELMERVREARHLREETREDAERLWQAVLAETFPRPDSELPEGWRWVRLGEILVEKPQYGYTSSASPDPVGPKFLRITDITSGEIVWENVPYCNIDAQSLSKYRLRSGDILFARTGSIGATILVEEVPCEAIFASYLIRVRLQTGILPEFVSLILKAPPCQRQFVPLGAAQKNINAKAIQQIILPFPPLSEQRRIVAYLEVVQERVKAFKEAQARVETELKRLEQAILEKAFRGEL
ncbi:Type-1 restriction enzyme EcoKI specificity protein [bacterium HR16]|nr:Type-1 restriction enzyme EcoKI specificity protein [bacterium HR16]